MTEQLIKWVSEQTVSKVVEEWEHVHPLSRVAAEFWLRAFVGEVERRASQDSIGYDVGRAFDGLVREFGLDGEEK
jgi:hypothetical protein